MSRALLLPVCVLLLGVFAGSASADGRSITALASVNVAVPKNVAQNDAAIRAAVQSARAKAGPAAIEAAKAEAQRLATAAGMTLGTLTAVAEVQPLPVRAGLRRQRNVRPGQVLRHDPHPDLQDRQGRAQTHREVPQPPRLPRPLTGRAQRQRHVLGDVTGA